MVEQSQREMLIYRFLHMGAHKLPQLTRVAVTDTGENIGQKEYSQNSNSLDDTTDIIFFLEIFQLRYK